MFRRVAKMVETQTPLDRDFVEGIRPMKIDQRLDLKVQYGDPSDLSLGTSGWCGVLGVWELNGNPRKDLEGDPSLEHLKQQRREDCNHHGFAKTVVSSFGSE
jgi:hypothetical protein